MAKILSTDEERIVGLALSFNWFRLRIAGLDYEDSVVEALGHEPDLARVKTGIQDFIRENQPDVANPTSVTLFLQTIKDMAVEGYAAYVRAEAAYDGIDVPEDVFTIPLAELNAAVS